LERRLTTILSADIAGYSRLMGVDEATTLDELKLRQDQLVLPLLGKSGGRLIKFLGDGFLAEFTSVVKSVHFAIDLQAASESRNRELPDDTHLHFRIGINLSDIIGDASDVYGDGVNVAGSSKALPIPAVSAFRTRSTTMSIAISAVPSRTSASASSRTSPALSRCTGCRRAARAVAGFESGPSRHNRLRSQFCPLPT
jgi:hypothetical protein